MAGLIVSGDFLTGPTQSSDPATVVALSVSQQDGSPVVLDFSDLANAPAKLFIALNTAFARFVPLEIKEVFDTHAAGFYMLRVEGSVEFNGMAPQDAGVASMAVVVEHGGVRGQALFCCCGVAGIYDRMSPTPHGPEK
jgi:hypothetical protein